MLLMLQLIAHHAIAPPPLNFRISSSSRDPWRLSLGISAGKASRLESDKSRADQYQWFDTKKRCRKRTCAEGFGTPGRAVLLRAVLQILILHEVMKSLAVVSSSTSRHLMVSLCLTACGHNSSIGIIIQSSQQKNVKPPSRRNCTKLSITA